MRTAALAGRLRPLFTALPIVATLLTPAAQAANNLPVFKIGVDLAQQTPIHPEIFGESYIWDLIPQGSDFANFARLSDRLRLPLLRFPGGWDAEVYDWQNNTLTGSPGGRPIPAEPGATAWQAINAFPEVTFVMPSHDAIADRRAIPLLTTEYVNLALQYGRTVGIWEIGNEWWKQSGAAGPQRIERRTLRAYVRLLAAALPLMHDARPRIALYATGDWQEPQEFGQMRKMLGEERWSEVGGISVHVYCARLLGPTSCRAIPHKLGTIAALTQKPIYVSEWDVVDENDSDPGDYGIWSANEMVSAIQAMVQSGVTAAAFWPARGAGLIEPDVALFSADLTQIQATGALLGWMRAYYKGKAVTTIGVTRAAAAVNSRRLTLFVPTASLGHSTLRIFPASGYRMRSAEVMYSDDPTDPAQSQIVRFAAVPWTNGKNGSVEIEVDPGGVGRGSAAEILRVSFAAPHP